MFSYPIKFTPDDNGTVLATAPDFPELTTFGDDEDDALAHAVDALEEAIAARMANRQEIPRPSKGKHHAVLSAQTALKVQLYQVMTDQGVRKAELARRLAWHMPQVDRLFDLKHASRLDQMERAFGALGQGLDIGVRPTQ